jgi:hypothetical protein
MFLSPTPVLHSGGYGNAGRPSVSPSVRPTEICCKHSLRFLFVYQLDFLSCSDCVVVYIPFIYFIRVLGLSYLCLFLDFSVWFLNFSRQCGMLCFSFYSSRVCEQVNRMAETSKPNGREKYTEWPRQGSVKKGFLFV